MMEENGASEIFFELQEDFIKQFKGKQPNWGPLGYITYKRTYARDVGRGKTEEYWQTTKRVVEGVYTIQRRHCHKNKLPWSHRKAQASAQKMFQLMWEFKFTPPGRGFWMMGTDYMYKNGGAALNNCAFVSTENISVAFAEPFTFLMDMSMLGVGVGGDTKGAGKLTIREPRVENGEIHTIPDTREGWVEGLKVILKAYSGEGKLPMSFNFDEIRAFGEPIVGFGGTASGPEPLMEMYTSVQGILDKRVGEKITSSDIVDIFNLIGKCVVAGNVRRTAEIMFGDPNDKEFAELKDPEKNKEALENHRWASNNSIFAEVGMDYEKHAESTAKNGEPGYEWLKNAQAYSRMGKEPDYKDHRAKGGNPCLEQTLETYELCCLVETYPSNHESMSEWIETLKYAYLYAKAVTLVSTHNPLTNAVLLRNRRIGCSISGITQAFKKFGRRKFLQSCDMGYDRIQELDTEFSDWLCIPRSKKTTSVKPSGTVSLLAGVTPGIHYPISEYYIRNIRFQKDSPLLDELKEAGYKIEKCVYSDNSRVVSFPIKEEYFDRSVKEVSMWEQMENVAQIQEHWADNQVSVTVSFSADEAKDIKHALELYETRIKGVSFLPKADHKYQQAPYIPITEKEYTKMVENTSKVKLKGDTHEQTDKFCDGASCEIKFEDLGKETIKKLPTQVRDKLTKILGVKNE